MAVKKWVNHMAKEKEKVRFMVDVHGEELKNQLTRKISVQS